MNGLSGKYEQSKWLEMEQAVHQLYRSHPDPRSAIASYDTASIISSAFPNISRQEAMRNSSAIIENFTGHKLETQDFITEFKNTYKAQAEDLNISMQFSKAFMAANNEGLDSEAFKRRINQAMESLEGQKLTYRNDFKDMSVFTDLLTETARILPSMWPTIAMYGAGGLLAGVTGGTSLIGAKVAGAVYSGMMEAGGVVKELYGTRDDDGNRLDDEYVFGAWALTMLGVGAITFFTDPFEHLAAGVTKTAIEGTAKALFGKQATKELVRSGVVKSWGKRVLVDYALKGIAGEAVQESLQELTGMAATNYMLNKSNKELDTIFEGHSLEEIKEAMAQVAVSTAKGMVLMGLPSTAAGVVQDYTRNNSAIKREANTYTDFSRSSVVLETGDIQLKSSTEAIEISAKVDPIRVIQVGDKFKPVDGNNASIIAGLKKKGAKALNVEVVTFESDFTRESYNAAQSFAQIFGKETEKGVVLYDSEAEMRRDVKSLALRSDDVVGYYENDGIVIINRKGEDGIHAVIFQTKEAFSESSAKTDIDTTIETGIDLSGETEPVQEAGIDQQTLFSDEAKLSQQEESISGNKELPPIQEVVRKEYDHYQRTLKRRGASDMDVVFLESTVLPKIAESLRSQFPNLTSEQIYQAAIPSAYFAFLASRVADMDVQTFFEKHLSSDFMVGMTQNEVQAFLDSEAGRQSISIELGNKGGEGALLGGLLVKGKDGKYTIALGNNYDPLVVVHELGHVLVDVIKDTDQFKPFLDIYSAELGLDGDKIGMNFQEAFARDLEAYIVNGKLRDSSLATIFRKIREAIHDFLDYLYPNLDDKTRIAFDKLFDIKKEAVTDNQGLASLQLDLFGNPETVADTLAKISSRNFWHPEEVISDYDRTVDQVGVDYDWHNNKTIAPHWFWLNRLKFKKDAEGNTFRINDGPIRISSRNINHILNEHSKDGVNLFHVSKIARELANPVMIIESPSKNEINKGGPLFVTRYVVNYRGEMQPLLIALRNYLEYPDGKYGEAVENGMTVNSMYPWKPELNDGKSLADYALEGNVLAINGRAFGKPFLEYIGDLEARDLSERIKTRPLSETQTLPGSLQDIKAMASERNILDIGPYVNKENMVDFFDNRVPTPENPIYMDSLSPESQQVLASVKKRTPLELIKEQLSKNHYPSDEDLQAHAGDPNVDWEIQFRRIMTQDQEVYKAFQKAFRKAELYADQDVEVTPQMVLDRLDVQSTTAAFADMVGEVRNPLRFIERMMAQDQFQSPTEADRRFRNELSKDSKLIEVARVLTEGESVFTLNNRYPHELQHLVFIADRDKVTQNALNRARALVRDQLREFRRDYYRRTGMDAQLSYEETVEGSFLDTGKKVEAFANEEISRILSDKNTDPVVKSLIRRDLATGDVLSVLIEETSAQIDSLTQELDISIMEARISEKELQSTQAELGGLEKQYDSLEARYRSLQEKNKLNSSHKRMYKKLNELKAKRIEYMKLAKKVEDSVISIKKVSESKNSQNDAKIMKRLRSTIDILLKSEGQSLEAELEKMGMTVSDIPSQLLPFFEINSDGVFAENIATRMDIKRLAALNAAAIDVRREARAVQAMKNADRHNAAMKISMDFMRESKSVEFDSESDYRQFMDQQKYDGNVKDAKNKAKAFFETQFITMSRILDRLDPTGKSLKAFVFGGYDSDGTFHRGLEGVIDDSKRAEYDRYSAMRDVMTHLDITEKALLKKHISLSAGDLTLDQALGVYIYAQQEAGMKKLVSPDGNKLVVLQDRQGNIIKNEVQEVIASLTDNQKAFADWMIDDMGSRFEAIADVYYKVNNKELDRVSRYFPFVGNGETKSFNDLMADQFLNMQDTPDDSITRARHDANYELQLNAVSVWSKMVAKQEHYIAGAEYFNTMNWAMNKNGGDLYNLIAINNGEQYAKAFKDFLQRTANRRFMYDDADAVINKVRSNLLVARLGFNVLTVAKQIPSLGYFAMEYGPARLFEAIAHLTTDYKGTSEFIYEKAPQMRGHASSIDFSAFTQLEAQSEFGRVMKKVGEAGMAPIQFVDGLVKKTLWYGAYQDNIAKGMTDTHAAMEATRFINDTQPGGLAKDTAAIYSTNSTMVKFLLMFTNQLNKTMNIAYDIPHALKMGMYERAFMNTMGLGLAFAGIVALEGGYSDMDDDDKWKDLLNHFSSQLVNTLPIFGPGIADIMMDRYYSDNGLPMLSETNSLIKAFGSGQEQRIKDSATRFGFGAMEVTGLPSGQMKKLWDAFNKEDAFNYRYLFGRDFVE